ncbi:hypothetical protein BA953_18150 [Vibrio coralliilyticus]|uniref:ABC transporter permease n=1 Tax=Vibrio coralliilyticus TaxID=190893 RepID=UPI000810ADE4|nr:ABC transporter permease [Vibrio coralliilyticus]ANW26102.1 hypothetical protein BA953_18150 [Vibrio coralliilyticus]
MESIVHQPKRKLRISSNRDIGILIATILVGVFFSVLAPNYFSSYTFFTLLRQTAELGIVAMAMTILIVSGEFDLTVGAVYAVVGVAIGILFKQFGIDLWLAAIMGLLIAISFGYINGVLITKTGMNSFIGTLALMMVYRGIAMMSTGGSPVTSFPKVTFFEIAGRAKLFGVVPIPILWLTLIGVVLYILLHRTEFGVKAFATGDNKEAARLSGIDTDKVKIRCFMLTAACAGIAAIISLGYLRTATPSQGNGMELEAIAAAVIGGTAMTGGVGSIIGTFMGALIMAQVRVGLVLMGTDAYIQEAFVGLVIAVAVILNIYISKKRLTE